MKNITFTLYQCETCGAKYQTTLEAELCEKFHIKPREIKHLKYQPYNNHEASRYPTRITVIMSNGEVLYYSR